MAGLGLLRKAVLLPSPARAFSREALGSNQPMGRKKSAQPSRQTLLQAIREMRIALENAVPWDNHLLVVSGEDTAGADPPPPLTDDEYTSINQRIRDAVDQADDISAAIRLQAREVIKYNWYVYFPPEHDPNDQYVRLLDQVRAIEDLLGGQQRAIGKPGPPPKTPQAVAYCLELRCKNRFPGWKKLYQECRKRFPQEFTAKQDFEEESEIANLKSAVRYREKRRPK